MKTLGEEADRLAETHPDQCDDIKVKQEEIVNNWVRLKEKVTNKPVKIVITV